MRNAVKPFHLFLCKNEMTPIEIALNHSPRDHERKTTSRIEDSEFFKCNNKY